MEKHCAYCKKIYSKNPKYSQKQWEASRYCSNSCSGIVSGKGRGSDYMRRIATGVVQPMEVRVKRGIYKTGADNPLWQGGISDDGAGYLRMNDTRDRIHRVVMSRHLGRKLERSEHVHHIDGNKKNNSIDNLMLLSASEHSKLHHKNRRKAV